MLDGLAIALQGVGYDSPVLALQGFYLVDALAPQRTLVGVGV